MKHCIKYAVLQHVDKRTVIFLIYIVCAPFPFYGEFLRYAAFEHTKGKGMQYYEILHEDSRSTVKIDTDLSDKKVVSYSSRIRNPVFTIGVGSYRRPGMYKLLGNSGISPDIKTKEQVIIPVRRNDHTDDYGLWTTISDRLTIIYSNDRISPAEITGTRPNERYELCFSPRCDNVSFGTGLAYTPIHGKCGLINPYMIACIEKGAVCFMTSVRPELSLIQPVKWDIFAFAEISYKNFLSVLKSRYMSNGYIIDSGTDIHTPLQLQAKVVLFPLGVLNLRLFDNVKIKSIENTVFSQTCIHNRGEFYSRIAYDRGMHCQRIENGLIHVFDTEEQSEELRIAMEYMYRMASFFKLSLGYANILYRLNINDPPYPKYRGGIEFSRKIINTVHTAGIKCLIVEKDFDRSVYYRIRIRTGDDMTISIGSEYLDESQKCKFYLEGSIFW